MSDPRKRPIKGVSVSDGTILEFTSCGEAAAHCRPDIKLNSAKTKIYEGLKDGNKTVYGYKWTYEDTEVDDREWRPFSMDGVVEGWMVSEDGDLKSPQGRMLVGSVRKDGLVQMQVGDAISYKHHIVAAAFLPPATNESEVVVHIDGNKQNNHYSSLQWTTRSQVVLQQYANKPNKKIKRIDQFTLDMKFVDTHKSIAAANRSIDKNAKWTGISSNLARKTADSGGYIWKYHGVSDTPDTP